MKLKLTSIIFLLLIFVSCNRNIYGIYSTEYLTDKSTLLQIRIDSNYYVEKNEIHTIRIDSKGTWKQENGKIICFFYPTITGFPADTMYLKINGNRMYILTNGIVKNKNLYLKKVK